MPFVTCNIEPPLATITLNDPARRNALGLAMFEALDEALVSIPQRDDVHIVLLHGEGPAFCAGFDLGAAAEDTTLLEKYILELSLLLRALRRLPQIVVAAVHGPAIAGGCAILSACDFVFVAPDAKIGYPVHRIGISPAVTIPALEQAVGAGRARELVMLDDLIDGTRAHRISLASHLARSAETVKQEARQFCADLSQKGPHALRITKAWVNELDGSLENARFEGPAKSSAASIRNSETAQLLANHWSSRK